MFQAIANILAIADLRRRLFFTFMALAIYRIGFHIYLPGVRLDILDQVKENAEQNTDGLVNFIAMTSMLTGGALSQAAVFSLGIMPYISASIIFSLMTKVFPKLEELQKEGESGRKVINRWTRYSTVLLCLIQSLLVVQWVASPDSGVNGQAISESGFGIGLLQVMVLTGGTLFLMWLGEKITENGIGNGISLMIMAGIVSSVPASLLSFSSEWGTLDPDGRPFFILRMLSLIGFFLAVVAAVVFITKGQRRIPIQNARTVRGAGGQRHYMPIKVNSAGVLPIIFAQSLLIIPGVVLGIMGATTLSQLLSYGTFWYLILYALMILFFTYFWTSLYYNPVEIADNMKEHGSFVPGIRPGRRTAEYLQQVFARITLAGAVFLAAIALIPMLVTQKMGIDSFAAQMLGGTGILITVGVALDLVDKIEAQLLARQYEGFVAPRRKKSGAVTRDL
ncbi:MAG: preprotein translocase subunit SecY [Planctomycetota bacterium]|nr:MAG: preprotein translocase subunit SecY [Planctomycetota bacterium]